jgi:hypothetical protein
MALAAKCGSRWAKRVQESSHDGIRLLMNVWRSTQAGRDLQVGRSQEAQVHGCRGLLVQAFSGATMT